MKIRDYIVLTSLLVLGGCSSTINRAGHGTYETIQKDNRVIQSDVSLSIIKTGKGSTLEAFVFEGGSYFSVFEISHSAILVKHPKGNILIDTGLGQEVQRGFDEEFPWYLKPIFMFEKEKAVVDVLAENNISINSIVLTHAHWDHASGVEDFHDTPIYTTKAELEFAKQEWDDIAYMKSAIDSKDIDWKFIDFSDKAYENFEHSYDFYGDGSIVLVPLIGHSPGQIGIFVNTLKSRYFFSGDVTWSYDALVEPRERYWFTKMLADADAEQNIEAILQVNALMKQNPNMIIIPSHDMKVHTKLGFFPKQIR